MPSIFLDFERTLAASPNDVRVNVQNSLHALGFELTTQQVTLIEGRRGHSVMGSLMGAANMPVQIAATLSSTEDGTRVSIRLADHLASIGRTWGANTTYQRVFADVQEAVDTGLAQLDPGAASGFAPPRFTSKAGTVAALETTSRVTTDVTGAAVSKFNQLLSGGPRTRVPDSWKQLDTVVLCSDEGAARLELEELQAHLAVAVLISTQPGSLPPALAAQVEALATRVEQALNSAGTNRYVEIPISDDEEPVVEFLHQQARMRQQFAVRTLHRCRTCKFEKITNPDFERLQKRNSRLRALGGSVGASFGRSGVSPFVLVGTLMRFAKLDPDYVCPRCQGIDAEAMVVTFCPDCGSLRTEAALRTCPKCHLDMRTKLSPDQVWAPYPQAPAQDAGARLPGAVPPDMPPGGGPPVQVPSGTVPQSGGSATTTPWLTSTDAAPPPPPPPPPPPLQR